MAHHIYQTEGLILGGGVSGEANREIDVFTRSLGLVRVRAQGVRKLQSKLRYALQDFSFSIVSIVRGKELWRLTNAFTVSDFYHDLQSVEEKRALARITLLLRRLLNGEEKNEYLFELVTNALQFLKSKLSEEEIKGFETLVAIRMLNSLGYWGRNEMFDRFADGKEWNKEILEELMPLRTKAVALINAALRESQL
jgi:DNA repair protein RecO (recombination protein O)